MWIILRLFSLECLTDINKQKIGNANKGICLNEIEKYKDCIRGKV